MESVFEKFKMNGKIAVVTGGAGLLGRQFCHTLAEAGAKVVVADLDADGAKQVSGEIKAEGCQSLALKVDVTSLDSVSEMVRATEQLFGNIDVLVCSAAMDPKFDSSQMDKHQNSFEDYPLHLWQQALEVNLTGLFLCSQAAVKSMLDAGSGVIVFLCSTYGLVGPDQRIYERPGKTRQYKPVYYTVTKAGVLGLTKYLATYYAGTKIRVNALTPGGIFNQHEDAFVQNYAARTVLGRMANLDEMNAALLFLASEASSYMTGANLVVDGGWTAW